MSNDNVYERLWKLQASVNKLILDGKRDPKMVANVYQGILSGSVEVTFDKPVPELVISALEPVGTVVVPGTIGKFVAKEKFVRDIGNKAKVKISHLGDSFIEWFFSGAGKTEDPESEQTLHYHKLRQSLVDGPIIAELGGKAKAETTLSKVFSLMEKQGKGESGVLLNNGYANIFYIKDFAGSLRTVHVDWRDDGWCVGAYSVEDPGRWLDGRQVFSRNPLDTMSL